MKLVSLNCWCGHEFETLTSFIEEQSRDTDVFCLQEMVDAKQDFSDIDDRSNLMTEIGNRLPAFDGFFHPMIDGMLADGTLVDHELPLGQAMFIRRGIAHGDVKDRFVYRTYNQIIEGDISSIPRNVQYVTLTGLDRPLNILNFHGLWWNSYKDDNEHRLEQSRKILDLLSGLKGEVVLTGDFNLKPETKSLALFEGRLRNLIKEFGVTDTRTSLYKKPIRHADYILVSENVKAKSFEVPDLPISDHRPMILEFSL
ncbi:MAG: endonuclease/exonuclease/phosphatase family protein [bacterium]|nr:endonuclease/exonuclease/phosphatase family protein [bacterium]MDZ4248177.1 endonuclease/exonuclease/phosphatase family protein [Patescibacteria group bacterium]